MGLPYHTVGAMPALGYVSMTAESVPASQLSTSVSDITTISNQVLRTDWGAPPGGARVVSFELAAGDVVLLFADVINLQHYTANLNAYFRIIVDGTHVVANWDTGDSNGWNYDAISFHGVALDLGIGVHTAEIQFKVHASSCALETVCTPADAFRVLALQAANYVRLFHSTNGNGAASIRLSALTQPSEALGTTVNFPTNLKAAGTSTTWASLPEFPMRATFEVSSGESVLLLADISYVRHDDANINTFFQIIVDDSLVIAYSNTGNAAGLQYRSLSFHGVASGLSTGSHTAELQVHALLALFKHLDSKCRHACI